MIIVSGKLYVDATQREAFLSKSLEAVIAARAAPGCLDFVVAADPLEADRVNVYERWEPASAPEAIRGAGLGDDIGSMIVRADVSEHEIASSKRA
jgi:quinol monooxygenase YgiN